MLQHTLFVITANLARYHRYPVTRFYRLLEITTKIKIFYTFSYSKPTTNRATEIFIENSKFLYTNPNHLPMNKHLGEKSLNFVPYVRPQVRSLSNIPPSPNLRSNFETYSDSFLIFPLNSPPFSLPSLKMVPDFHE
jgi:hypothetical protein